MTAVEAGLEAATLEMMPTAAIIIIGREILTGKFADENGPFFVERFRSLGTDLRRLVTIDDDIDAISEEVRRCADRVDHVFTTGGVGPTHDDVTLEAIAKAFDRPLVRIESLVVLMKSYGVELTPANLKMAMVPRGCELLMDETSGFPLLRCENVWILPGVPKLVRRKFPGIVPFIRGPELHTLRLHLDVHETDISDRLTEIAAAHLRVDIGSYPRFEEGPNVILTLESLDRTALEAAKEALCEALPVRSDS